MRSSEFSGLKPVGVDAATLATRAAKTARRIVRVFPVCSRVLEVTMDDGEEEKEEIRILDYRDNKKRVEAGEEGSKQEGRSDRIQKLSHQSSDQKLGLGHGLGLGLGIGLVCSYLTDLTSPHLSPHLN